MHRQRSAFDISLSQLRLKAAEIAATLIHLARQYARQFRANVESKTGAIGDQRDENSTIDSTIIVSYAYKQE